AGRSPMTLDNPQQIRSLDPAGMYDRIAETADVIERAWRVADGAELPDKLRTCRNIVVLGMGGSAIGGDLVRSLTQDLLTVPMLVNREYDVPGFVGPDTLVIASSYSGGTEETLSAVEQATEVGSKIVAITTGGTLGRKA